MPSTPRSIISSKNVAHAVGVGAVEQRGVGRHAEAALHRFPDAFDRDVVAAFAADGEIVVLALAVHVDGEGQVLAGLEQVELLFQQQRVGAEVDVLLARDQAFDDLRRSAGACSGSPPGMETIGAPHSSTARKHCSGVSCFFRMWAGYWILPQPAQARLQRNSGSSISTSG